MMVCTFGSYIQSFGYGGLTVIVLVAAYGVLRKLTKRAVKSTT